jgi:hypothetical protein
MIYTLTRLYKVKGEIVLSKAVAVGWITEIEMQQIIEENAE